MVGKRVVGKRGASHDDDDDDDDDDDEPEEGSHLPAAEPEEKSAYHQL